MAMHGREVEPIQTELHERKVKVNAVNHFDAEAAFRAIHATETSKAPLSLSVGWTV